MTEDSSSISSCLNAPLFPAANDNPRNNVDALGEVPGHFERALSRLGRPDAGKLSQYIAALAAVAQAMPIHPDLGARDANAEFKPPQCGVDDADITSTSL